MAFRQNPTSPAQALLVDESDKSSHLGDLLQSHGLKAHNLDLARPASEKELRDADVAVVAVDWSRINGEPHQILKLINTLSSRNIATLVLGVPDNVELDGGPLVDRAPMTASREDIAARLSTFARFAPLIKRLDRELHHLQRLGKRLNHHFADIDAEMRLAGRLQRDFLPRTLPAIPPLSFETLFRPASWVSGDVYDVFRIDERHVGLFVADAVGHGLAAGLLTMFLRQALVTKRIDGQNYDLIEPCDAISNLHRSLVQQALPNCWFVTASYAVINTTSLELTHARGGHPYPLHITADGKINELQTPGGLLGLSDIEDNFGQQKIALNAGDKVVFYSDGLESHLVTARTSDTAVEFTPQLLEWAKLPAKGFIQALSKHLDRHEGSLNPPDDMTSVVIQVGA